MFLWSSTFRKSDMFPIRTCRRISAKNGIRFYEFTTNAEGFLGQDDPRGQVRKKNTPQTLCKL
jgi:hypothetical protein